MVQFEETVERKITETIVKFKAEDGTVFEDEDDCLKWEKSRYGMLFYKLSEFKIKDEYSWAQDDSDGNYYITVLPTQESHIDTLNQLYCMFGGSAIREKKAEFSQKDIGFPIMVGYRFDDAYTLDWVWFYKITDMLKEIAGDKFIVVSNSKEDGTDK